MNTVEQNAIERAWAEIHPIVQALAPDASAEIMLVWRALVHAREDIVTPDDNMAATAAHDNGNRYHGFAPKMGGTSLAEKIAKAIHAHNSNQRIDCYVWELLPDDEKAKAVAEAAEIVKAFPNLTTRHPV